MAGVDPLIRVTVVRDDGLEFEALTRGDDHRIELHPPAGVVLPTLRQGERLGLRRPVADDAMYVEPVVVTETAPGATDAGAILEVVGSRQRNQQRDHVRIALSALDVALDRVRDDDEQDEDERSELGAQVLDVSAGGVRVHHVGSPLPVGSTWRTRAVLLFDDGSELPLEQLAEVCWSFVDGPPPEADAEDDGGLRVATAGLRYLDVRPATQERITRWVFQQQAKLLRVRRGR